MVLEVRLKKRKNLETIMVSRLFCGAAGQIRTADLILTKAGQYIKFYAIDQAEFDRIAALEASSGYTVHTYPRKEAEQA